jgi:hypothetical protein
MSVLTVTHRGLRAYGTSFMRLEAKKQFALTAVAKFKKLWPLKATITAPVDPGKAKVEALP